MTDIKRIYSEPPRDITWRDYHADMTDKYAHLVRFKDGRKAYYTDAPIDAILTQETDGFVEIVNCDWQADTWDSVPYMWRIGNEYKGRQRVITEVFHVEGGNEVGYLRNGVWVLKVFRTNGVYFMRDVASGYSMGSAGQAVYKRLSSGVWCIGTAGFRVEADSAPQDLLYRIARRLKAEHRRGFYDKDIEWLVEVGGLRADQI